ncbi:hypothetical protein FRC00_003940 [Tulasnella sp. 408]|nr:hypothetical protein FRC00_003940 [Tulasnella sp. 408]
MGLLRCQAPQLRELYLDFQCSLYGTLPQQPIIDPGEGQPLRHLCLNSVRLPWSTRLRQLKTLQLYSIESPPSREELYSMLRSSTQLEQLVLSALGWNAAQEQLLDAGLAEPITFLYLAEITLFDLHTELTDFLCSVVRAPNTESLVVGSAPVEMLSLQNTECAPFHTTVAGCIGNLSCIDIDLDPIRGSISISTVPRSGNLPPPSPKWKQSEVTHSLKMDCVGDNVLLDFPILAEFLAEQGDGIEFRLNVFPTDWDPSEDEVDALVRGMTTLTGLVDLDIQYFQGGGQVVRHLSVEYENDLGALAWVCPWLTRLNVKDVPDIDRNDWNALLEARGPRRTALPSGEDSPVRITDLQANVKEMRQTPMIYGP